jgi:DNA-binding NtrC family response regulator
LAKGKILVMDDEDLVRIVAGKMLEFLGYEVVLAREGREAISLFQSHRSSGNPFDAVVLDLVVPGGLDGRSTLAELLRIDPNTKGVISSGYGDAAPAGTASEGQVATIAKPYELKKLGETLDRVLSGSPA